jgi:hypothetical protein
VSDLDKRNKLGSVSNFVWDSVKHFLLLSCFRPRLWIFSRSTQSPIELHPRSNVSMLQPVVRQAKTVVL